MLPTNNTKSENTPLVENKPDDQVQEESGIDAYKRSYTEIKKSPIDLWNVYIIRLFGYSGCTMILVCLSVYCTEILDLTDFQFGIYSLCLGTASLLSFFIGNLPNKLGIRNSMLLTSSIGFLCYLALVIISNLYVRLLVIMLIFFIPLTVSIPITKFAVNRYTNSGSKSLAFSIFTLLMYASAGLSAIYIGIALGVGDQDEETFRIIFIVATVLMGTAVVQAFFLRELDFAFRGEEIVEIKGSEESNWEYLKAVVAYKSFWRLLGISVLISVIRSSYEQIAITLPLYLERDLEENSLFAYVLALNQLFMIIFCPSLTILVHYFDKYTLFVISGAITALSPLVFLFGASY